MFTDDEVGFVKVVAGQAATAIENARLMSETLEMKRTLETRKLVERQGHPPVQAQPHRRRGLPALRNESRRLRRPMRDLPKPSSCRDLNKTQGEGSRGPLVD